MNKEITGARRDRILVVDDTTADLQLLTSLLTEQGYTVHPASDGALALRFVQLVLPDLILLDVRMPGTDGYEVCRRLKADERTRAIPVIFISILEDALDKVKGLQEGAVDFITKPFQPEEVLSRVGIHLRLRDLTERLEQKVSERTEELMIANQRLQHELAERERAEEALRRSEEKYRRIVDTAGEGIWMIGPDGVTTLVNAKMAEMLGYSAEEMVGRPATDFMFGDDKPDHEARRERRCRGVSETYERRFRRKDGETLWTSISATGIFDDEGRFNGSFAMFTDITQRKRAEAQLIRLFTAVEHAGESILVTDSEGTILYVNPAFEKTTGYARHEAIGSNPRILRSGKHDKAFYQQMWNTLLSRNIWRGEFTNRKKDGTLYEETATISPVMDEADRIVNFVAVKRDVTGENLLQRQLIQAQKMESIGTLAGGIAHDFNNLLHIIAGHAELLEMDLAEKNLKFGELDAIRQSARRGADLIKQILTFSRRIDSKFESINLNQEVKTTERLLNRTIPKMIEIELRLEPGLERVRADSMLIEQVLINLAVNAKDAMPEGGRLTIETENVLLDEEHCRCHAELVPGRYVLLRVSDTGHGMSEAVREHIFEPFFTTKGLADGTGLGLATAFGILKMHGGHITCESEVGKGTTFQIHLPTAEAFTPDMEHEQEAAAVAGASEKILVVDDEPMIRDLAKRMLEKAGYSVLTAGSGKEGIEVYGRHKSEISLVVLDLVMPEMGGKQCLEELLKVDPQVKALIASGFAVKGNTKAFLDAEAKGMVSKPFDMNEMLRAVRNVLDGM